MRRFLCILVVLPFGIIGLKAQDYPVSILDGPALQVDSMSVRSVAKPSVPALFLYQKFTVVQNPTSLMMPPSFETKEQRAARINLQTFNSVMISIDQDLYWHRLPKFPKTWKHTLGAARLFLSNPYGFPGGCVPLMNASFPFIFARKPGMAPYENPYTSDQFPECIESEYDSATGTYKQVMVDWSVVRNRISSSTNIH